MVSQEVERLSRRLAELDRASHMIARWTTAYGLWMRERASVAEALREATEEVAA